MNTHRVEIERHHLGGEAERIATSRALEDALGSIACPDCGGSGMTYPNGPIALVFDLCAACNGTGRVAVMERES